MKRWLSIFIAIASLITATPAMAQTALSTTTCPGAGCDLETTLGAGTLSIQIVGTFTGTLQFEQSNDGATWVALNVYAAGSTTAVTSTTAAGLWNAPVSTKQMRVRFSAYTSGTATVYVSTTAARGSGTVFPIALVWPALAPNGSATAPSYGFASEASGIYLPSANNIGFSVGATLRMQLGTVNFDILSDAALLRLGSNQDMILARDAANTLAQRNGTNAQTFRMYNTFTDASNYERALFGWTSNVLTIGSEIAGTGASRTVKLLSAGTAGNLIFGTNSSDRWVIGASTGHLTAGTDNTYDIGASGATRPRTGYFGTSLVIGTNPSTTGAIALATAAAINFRNNANTNDVAVLTTNSSDTIVLCGTNCGGVVPGTANVRDLGASAMTWRTGYFGTSVVTPTVNATTAYQVAGVNRIYFVTADFTTAANTNLQIITGLVIPLPANTALNMPVRCVLFYSQATAAVSDSFGIQTDTVTPSNIAAGGAMETALGTTAYGDATITNTTATAVVTGTPSAIATVFNAYLDAFVENPSNASTTNINIMVKTSVSGDAITIKRGSFCRAF